MQAGITHNANCLHFWQQNGNAGSKLLTELAKQITRTTATANGRRRGRTRGNAIGNANGTDDTGNTSSDNGQKPFGYGAPAAYAPLL